MNNWMVAGILGVVSVLACGETKPGYIGDPDGGSGNTSLAGSKTGGRPAVDGAGGAEGGAAGDSGQVTGTAGMDQAGGEAGAPTIPQGTPPQVVVTSPEAVTDPNTGDVLATNSVEVKCIAKQAAAGDSSPVNPSSVVVAVLDATGGVLQEKPADPTGNPDEYANEFTLTNAPGGKIGFQCRAADVDQRVGAATIYSLLDKGPAITFVTPLVDSKHRLTGPLVIKFTALPNELAPGDLGAQVDTAVLDVRGVPIVATPVAAEPGAYQATIQLDDGALFTPPLTGAVPITVVATNKRTPLPVAATSAQQIFVDGTGPVIAITSPTDKVVVGGKVKLTFTVRDPGSGVDLNSVAVTLNEKPYGYAPGPDWAHNSGSFTYEFDSRRITESKVQITVNVKATDLVGNPSQAPQSIILYLDNFPPSVDLDPLNVRTITLPPKRECSISFDPVGERAKNDLEHAVRAGMFRALVWEETNSDPEIRGLHYSGTNVASVGLYLQGTGVGDTPLLINNDDDLECDDIGNVDPSRFLQLDPIKDRGLSWYSLDTDTPPETSAFGCTTKAGTAPPKLCTAQKSDMWQVIEHDGDVKEPAVYARSVTTGGECTGIDWEFGPKLNADGWACFAARAVDSVGNIGVSRPLRICVDDPERPGTPPCANSSGPIPSCTDGCTPPARWGNVGIELR